MKKGISLHIGLNSIDPAYYGDEGRLKNPENDANAMEQLAVAAGFKPTKLLTKAATSANVLTEIYRAADSLASGDTFLLTYAGHGSQVKDLNAEEQDQYDETWVLYDRMLLDDELYNTWPRFKTGVRVIVLSDSCNSGTVVRFFERMKTENTFLADRTLYRGLNPAIAEKVFLDNIEDYKGIKFALLREKPRTINASVLLISGCQDNQLSSDGIDNGLFTAELLRAWANGAFKGNYPSFHNKIRSSMPAIQTPNYYKVGAVDPRFEEEKPFTINSVRNREERPGELSNRIPKAEFLLEIPHEEFYAMKDDELRVYFSQQGGAALYEIYQKVKEAADSTILTRGGSVDIGCKVDKDKWSCEGKLSIRF
jgi:hypothetical protein